MRSRTTRLLEALARITGRASQRSDRLERWLLLVAAVIFAIATIAAWRRASPDAQDLDALWILVGAGLALGSMSANALEFGISGRLLGRRLAGFEIIRVSVLGSAANLLPIPGAVMIRMRALMQAGEGPGSALVVTAAMGMAWVGAAAGLAGGFLLWQGDSMVLGATFAVCSAVLYLGLIGLVRGVGGTLGAKDLTAVVGSGLLKVGLSSGRLYAIAKAVDFPVGLKEAVTINLGAILSHMIAVVPGGLGLRELLAGGFARLAGSSISIGVLISVLDRVLVYTALGLVVVILLLADRRRIESSPPDAKSPVDGS